MARIQAAVSGLALKFGAAFVLVACAPQAPPHAEGAPAAAGQRAPSERAPSSSSPSPPAAHGDVSPPPAVSVKPGGEPEAHPQAPESVPNKPETIPEEVPGTTPPK